MVKYNMRKIIVVAGIVLLVAVGTIIFYRIYVKEKDNNKQEFKTATVKRSSIIVKVTESGSVESETSVDVKSELTGEVKKISVKEGDSIKAGDSLALIQQETSQAQEVAQARASLKEAKLDLEAKEKDLKRTEGLHKKGFISQKELEDAKNSYKMSRITYELAKKRIWLILGEEEGGASTSLSSKSIETQIVKSPITGIVVNLNVEEGEIITSATSGSSKEGTTLMTVADLDNLIVTANINEVDVNRIKVGQSCIIAFDAVRKKLYSGVVKKISLMGSEVQRIIVYPTEIKILNPDSLIRLGMTADIDIIIDKAENVLVIPKQTLIKGKKNWGVIIIKNGNRLFQRVVTGIGDDINIEIKRGLKEGDTIMILQSRSSLNQIFKGDNVPPPGGGPPPL